MFQPLNSLRCLYPDTFSIRLIFAVFIFVICLSAAGFAATKFDFGGTNGPGGGPAADYVYYHPTVFPYWLGLTAGPTAGSTGVPVFEFFGAVGDRIAPADYNGDGFTDFAVFHPISGAWEIRYSIQIPTPIHGSTTIPDALGMFGDIPQSGNFSGTAEAEVAVFRPGTGEWFIKPAPNPTPFPSPSPIPFGTPGDKPVAEDYDGDGYYDLAIFRPSNGEWWIHYSSAIPDTINVWGISTDTPVPAKYDPDTKADIAVFRGGYWYILRSIDSSVSILHWGLPTDVPVPADYDGDGRTDIAIYRNGDWWVNGSFSGPMVISGLGAAGDEPVPHAYIP